MRIAQSPAVYIGCHSETGFLVYVVAIVLEGQNEFYQPLLYCYCRLDLIYFPAYSVGGYNNEV